METRGKGWGVRPKLRKKTLETFQRMTTTSNFNIIILVVVVVVVVVIIVILFSNVG